MSKILVVCPPPQIYGGVSNFYKVVAKKNSIFNFFYIGKRSNNNGYGAKFQTLFFYIWDYVRFIFNIHQYDLIVVNPSMFRLCLYRDSLYIRIARFFHKKVVVFWRGFNHIYFNNIVKYKSKDLLNKTFFKADHTIVLGENIYKALHELGCNTPHSISTTILPSDLLLQTPRTFSRDKFTILFLARIEKDKGIIEALDIYKIIKAQYSHSNMIIAGSGNLLNDVRQKIKADNIADVSLLGNVAGNAKYEAYYNADIYLFPSYYEGMPNSVLEAMGMGLPIITSKVGGIPDFFESGKMGYMIDQLHPEKFAEAIVSLIQNDDLSKISEYNRSFAKSHFLDSIVVDRLEKCLTNVADNKNTASDL